MVRFGNYLKQSLEQAVDRLVDVRISFPAEAEKLWGHDDGLPLPDEPGFVQAAESFLAEHPVSPPDQIHAVWDVAQVASRQCKCLSYLSRQEMDGRRDVAHLCVIQTMQLQWQLPLMRVHSSFEGDVGRAFYAACGALSFTGRLLLQQVEAHSVLYEMATQWLRTGMGQFATYGQSGDEVLRQAAETLMGDAFGDERIRELHGADEAFFSQIDLTRSEMCEVAKQVAGGDFEQARQAYAESISQRLTDKLDQVDVQVVKGGIDQEAEDICRNIFLLTIHMYKRVDFGEEVDWARVIDNDIESRVWLNGHHALMKLLAAYQKTGNEKYVKHLCRLFNSWYDTSPPTFTRSVAQWRTHEVAIRPDRRWPVILAGLAAHPRFKRECLFNMARSMFDHGVYLSMYSSAGGNWLQAEATGLVCVALLFPEFKLAPMFYQVGMNRLQRANAGYFLPDGFQAECTPGYHVHAISGMSTMLDLAKRFGVSVPANLIQQYQNAVVAVKYIAYPDLTLPMLSDQGPGRINLLERLNEISIFDQIAENVEKDHPSHDFTHAGYCVMRDKWESDGQVLIFDAGYFGSGHQHEDKLNFVYYANGRELIGDPGIYAYARDAFSPYWRGTWSHNSIVIDGLSQHRKLGPKDNIPDPDRRFVIGQAFDFAVGWYKHAYSPMGSEVWEGKVRDAERDRVEAIHDVQHQRCVFYVKGEYAIVCDRVLGVGEHQVDIIFHPAPVLTHEGARLVDLEVCAQGAVVTRESEYANVAILPAQNEGIEILDLVGQKNPHRGWYSLDGIHPSHDIVYRSCKALPAHIGTVIQPLPADESSPMAVASVRAECSKEATAIACGSDLLLLSYDGSATIKCRDVNFEGSVLLLRYDSHGDVYQAHMVDGRVLSIGGVEFFSTDSPASAYVLNF